MTTTELDTEKAAEVNALIDPPAYGLPSATDDKIKPFAIGLFTQFRARSKSDGTATAFRRALAAFTHSKRYDFASAQPDAMRYGTILTAPTEPISDGDWFLAQLQFLELRRKHADAQNQPIVALPAPKLSKTEWHY